MTDPAGAGRPGLARVLAAVTYDALLLFAALFAATVPYLAFTGGEAIRPHEPLYSSYLAVVSFAYFAWFWTRAGQTLGMRAWRLRVVDDRGQPPGVGRALARFAAALLSWALLGAGFAWIAFDRDGRSLHDRLSGTRLALDPRVRARGAAHTR